MMSNKDEFTVLGLRSICASYGRLPPPTAADASARAGQPLASPAAAKLIKSAMFSVCLRRRVSRALTTRNTDRSAFSRQDEVTHRREEALFSLESCAARIPQALAWFRNHAAMKQI